MRQHRVIRPLKSPRRTSLTIGLALCSYAAMVDSTMAQDAESAPSSRPIEEVMVTATKRETSMQDIPVAISAVTGESLEKSQTYDIESFARLDPAIQVNNRGVGDNQIIIRGISSAGKPTVGIYYDEAVITGLGLDGGSDNQPNIGMHDVQRVEILKGPQGTLFGANSMSGTMRVITNSPNLDEMEGSLKLSAGSVYGGNGLFRGEGVLNVPLIENTLAARAVIWSDNGGGYIDKKPGNGKDLKNVNDVKVNGAKLSFGWQPTDALNIEFSGLHQKSEVDDSQYFEFDEGEYNNVSPTAEPFEAEIDLFSLLAAYDLSAGTVTATASYMERDMFLSRDSTPTAIRFGIPALLAYHQSQDYSIFSSELRFASDFAGPVQLVTGLFYADQESDSQNAALVADPDSMVAPCDFHADCVSSGNAEADINSANNVNTIEQLAAFLETNIELSPYWTATLGVRYYEADIEDRQVTTQGLRFPTSPVQTDDEVVLDESISEDEFSYNVALSYAATENTTLYARAASGFRPGGVNNADNAADYGVTVPERYESDELWNYEIGAKSYLLDKKIYTELTLYHIDWSRQQISVTDPGGTFVYISNTGKSAVSGIEAMVNASFDNGLSGNIGITYTDSKLAEDMPDTAETSGYDGDRLPYSARWSIAGQLEYELPVDVGKVSGDGYVNANFNYRSDSYTGFNDEDPNYQKLDGYSLFGLRAGVRQANWDVNLFVDNVTNQAPEIGLRVTGDGYRVYTTRPRTIGLSYAYRY